MTRPIATRGLRDLSGVWDAVFAAAYVAEHGHSLDVLAERAIGDEARDEIARYAAEVADEAVRALHRVRGGEP